MGRLHQRKISLSEHERSLLEKGCRCGKWTARKVLRAQILLLADIGNCVNKGTKPIGDSEIAQRVGCSKSTVGNLRSRFCMERIQALEEKPRSGRPKIVDGTVEAQMISIACSTAPDGRQRWTLRLIADKLVELVDDLESISYTTVGKVLKKTSSNLG